MNELINITQTTINEEEVNAVNGRELWQKLGTSRSLQTGSKDASVNMALRKGKTF